MKSLFIEIDLKMGSIKPGILALLFMLFFRANTVNAQIDFPSFISDNMVLQRESEVPIWGKALPNTAINITCEWDNTKYLTKSNEVGKWTIKIKTPKAGGPYIIQVNNQQIKNILIGEVWVCSGQSNMTLSLSQSEDANKEIPKANFSNIRFFNVAHQLGEQPQDNCYGNWQICTPETARSFSAVAYYFGKKLEEELKVPIGLIHTSWGGSTAQAWVKEDLLKQDTSYNVYYNIEKQKAKRAKSGELPITQHSPSKLYNAMLHPLIPYKIKGVIWYQGESNQDYAPGDPDRYLKLFPLLINSWREDWKQGDFPFYYVQIAPYPRAFTNVGPLVRDVQRKTLNLPNTGMVVTLDVGDTTNIHPENKLVVGNRLALWALAKDYNQVNRVYSGPIYKSLEIKGKKAIIKFSEVGSGLMAKNNLLTGFVIAGEDQVFYKAEAIIDGNTVIVSSNKVKNPLAVRYAFTNTSIASLFNKEGLPASSFRTDDWKVPINRNLK